MAPPRPLTKGATAPGYHRARHPRPGDEHIVTDVARTAHSPGSAHQLRTPRQDVRPGASGGLVAALPTGAYQESDNRTTWSLTGCRCSAIVLPRLPRDRPHRPQPNRRPLVGGQLDQPRHAVGGTDRAELGPWHRMARREEHPPSVARGEHHHRPWNMLDSTAPGTCSTRCESGCVQCCSLIGRRSHSRPARGCHAMMRLSGLLGGANGGKPTGNPPGILASAEVTAYADVRRTTKAGGDNTKRGLAYG